MPIPYPSALGELLSFLDGLPDPRIVMDTDYRIVAANRAYVREFGGGQPIRGRKCYEVSHRFTVPCDQAGESCPLKQSLEYGSTQRILHLHHTPQGEEHVDVETTPIRDDDGNIQYFVETMRVVRQASSRPAGRGLVGRSPAFMAMLEKVVRVAPADASVLLLGETGTGKELVARAIHEASPRRSGPFVAVDCAGLTENLFESELFGYEKGAFTGANHRKLGLVEAASGGTLFLDEIGELPVSLQVKLLRLLEIGTYRRVGGLDTLSADFRLVAATHRDLRAMVGAETFRRDLFFRINVFPIRTPSLHQRREDIALLAVSLLDRVDHHKGRSFSPDALVWLEMREYSGNIRELRNLIERATLIADGGEITAQDLQEGIQDEIADSPTPLPFDTTPAPSGSASPPFQLHEVLPLGEVTERYLQWVYTNHPGPRRTLAAQLGMSPRSLYRRTQQATSQKKTA